MTSLNNNVRLLARDIQDIMAWGADNKIFFAPEKLEMIHLTRKAGNHALRCVVSNELTINPITTAPKEGASQHSAGSEYGLTGDAASSVMSQNGQQRPGTSHITSADLLEQWTVHQHHHSRKRLLPACYHQHSMAPRHGMQAELNLHDFSAQTGAKQSASATAGM